ncbi:spindle and kinetochore-associated protein 2 isoform X2 [Leucoraja erinacea]|uniref:spindle and kinetochore-associated protein 2 isoform X2 n=1 Tax=Leucoraja erinaceus TaxID=7782 RepID=UPI0024569B51|nr:spindle and kinetochore-associated protein 2 isoform X2 [Leucoraja erinacea]
MNILLNRYLLLMLHLTEFQKAQSDLDYIEHKLEFEMLKNLPQCTAPQENPIKLLEQLRVIKSRYRDLCAEADQIAIERKESVDFIRTQLATTLQLVQKLQDQSDLKSCPLTEDEQWAVQKIMKSEILAGVDPCEKPCAEPQAPQQEEAEFEPITEEMFTSVPKNVRQTVKLASLNTLYKKLFDHFIKNNNSAVLTVMQMMKLDIKVIEAELKTLKALELIQLDKKGRVRLSLQHS